jgi:ribosomal-protein-alanine acetyltransferase
MNPAYTLRPMHAADVDAVAAIEARLQTVPWRASQFAEILDQRDHAAWVIEHAACPVGFAITMQVLDEASLLNLGVDTPHQGRGLARRLLDAAFEAALAQRAAVMHLEVRVSNQRAQKLYRRAGFQAVGRRRNYYRTDTGYEDAILMTKTLDEGAR